MRTLKEKDLKRIIAEAISELQAFHGSGADFDKFNHKKYLSSGFGSQAFGWGTYVTTDITIANSYAETASRRNSFGDKSLRAIVSDAFNQVQIESNIASFMSQSFDQSKVFSIPQGYEEKYVTTFLYLFDQSDGDIQLFMEHCDNLINNAMAKGNEQSLQMYRFFKEALKKMPNNKAQSFIYEVDIPDDNGTNYLSWYETISPDQMKRIYQGILNMKPSLLSKISKYSYTFDTTMGLYAQYPNKQEMINSLMSDKTYGAFFGGSGYESPTGKAIYYRLEILFKSQKAASLFLMQCGFDGIVYPTGTLWGKPEGASEYAYNFVVFDANKVKIVKKELYNKQFQNNNQN